VTTVEGTRRRAQLCQIEHLRARSGSTKGEGGGIGRDGCSRARFCQIEHPRARSGNTEDEGARWM